LIITIALRRTIPTAVYKQRIRRVKKYAIYPLFLYTPWLQDGNTIVYNESNNIRPWRK